MEEVLSKVVFHRRHIEGLQSGTTEARDIAEVRLARWPPEVVLLRTVTWRRRVPVDSEEPRDVREAALQSRRDTGREWRRARSGAKLTTEPPPPPASSLPPSLIVPPTALSPTPLPLTPPTLVLPPASPPRY